MLLIVLLLHQIGNELLPSILRVGQVTVVALAREVGGLQYQNERQSPEVQNELLRQRVDQALHGGVDRGRDNQREVSLGN